MKRNSMLKIILLSLVVLSATVLVLFETVWKRYDVSYVYGDTVLLETKVDKKSTAQDYIPDIPGMRFLYWTDDAGEAIEPAKCVIIADTKFTAYMLPSLNGHESYLFCNEEGFILPYEALKAEDLSRAVDELISQDFVGYQQILEALPKGDKLVNAETLDGVLSIFFTDDEIQTACSKTPTDVISRADFAIVLNKLCGRTGEKVVPDSEALSSADLTPNDEIFCDMLEASVPHTVSDKGSSWSAVDITTGYAPGMLLLDGCLYCCDENGYIMKDTDIDFLHFTESGRYSSGDEELDIYVTDILREICNKNPDASSDELLRCAYDYIRDSYDYVGRNQYGQGARGWEIEDAKILFDTKLGNCFNYTACFWALARGLGYQADTMVKSLDGVNGSHAWVDIEFDGVPYIFDPMLEGLRSDNRYMLDYYHGSFLGYQRVVPWWE